MPRWITAERTKTALRIAPAFGRKPVVRVQSNIDQADAMMNGYGLGWGMGYGRLRLGVVVVAVALTIAALIKYLGK